MAGWGVLRWGPVCGGGPILSLQHNRLPKYCNPVNHLFRPGEMTEERLQANPLGIRQSGLDQTVANGVANQACRFMDIKLLHKPRPV
jgi:hypothetical protein